MFFKLLLFVSLLPTGAWACGICGTYMSLGTLEVGRTLEEEQAPLQCETAVLSLAEEENSKLKLEITCNDNPGIFFVDFYDISEDGSLFYSTYLDDQSKVSAGHLDHGINLKTPHVGGRILVYLRFREDKVIFRYREARDEGFFRADGHFEPEPLSASAHAGSLSYLAPEGSD